MQRQMILLIVVCLIIGLGAGLLGGLLGISGGIITVPCLIYLFKFQGFPSDNLVQLAVGTSLAAMVFNAVSSMRTHYKSGTIYWALVGRMLPGLVLGCFVGAYIGHLLPSAVLQRIFGCFAILLGAYFYFHQKLPDLGQPELPSGPLLNSLGLLVGVISNILGIGGGTMTVPLFVKLKLSIKSSVATSTVTGFIISFLGAFGYLFLGLGEVKHEMVVGFVYIPAFIVLALTTFSTAPFGARLAHRLHTDHLKKVFAASLVAIGIVMLLR